MASFEIVELDAAGKPRPFPAGVFPDGQSASSVLASLSARYPGKKFQPRPIKDVTSDWKAREQSRFESGVYLPLGWDLEPIKNHFAYKAIKTPKNVAFTPDDKHGQLDRQTSIHVNAYLNRFYPQLTIEQRRKYVWDYCGEKITDGLNITQDPDKIEWVYNNGPSSCMSGSSFASDEHPSRVYGGPDLGLAYLMDKTDSYPIARTVVWPDKKLFTRCYGDSHKLEEALYSEGYSRSENSTDWLGARLSTHWCEGTDDEGDFYSGYMCPYVDFAAYAKWDGTHLVICTYNDSGRLEIQNTGGVAYD